MDLAPIQALLETLQASPEVRRVILFGSRARGDASPRSDIDLAVDAPAMPRRTWLRLLDAVDDAPTLLPIELVHFQSATPRLRQRIEDEGRILYERTAA